MGFAIGSLSIFLGLLIILGILIDFSSVLALIGFYPTILVGSIVSGLSIALYRLVFSKKLRQNFTMNNVIFLPIFIIMLFFYIFTFAFVVFQADVIKMHQTMNELQEERIDEEQDARITELIRLTDSPSKLSGANLYSLQFYIKNHLEETKYITYSIEAYDMNELVIIDTAEGSFFIRPGEIKEVYSQKSRSPIDLSKWSYSFYGIDESSLLELPNEVQKEFAIHLVDEENRVDLYNPFQFTFFYSACWLFISFIFQTIQFFRSENKSFKTFLKMQSTSFIIGVCLIIGYSFTIPIWAETGYPIFIDID